MIYALIAAVAENDVIGSDGEIPWLYPEDLEHFQETTEGSPVVVGRVTFENIVDRTGYPLQDRVNIVLTSEPERVERDEWSNGRDPSDSPVCPVESVQKAMHVASECPGRLAYVAGGESVYRAFLPHADRAILTQIPETVEGDRVFPALDQSTWTLDSRESIGDLEVLRYWRRRIRTGGLDV